MTAGWTWVPVKKDATTAISERLTTSRIRATIALPDPRATPTPNRVLARATKVTSADGPGSNRPAPQDAAVAPSSSRELPRRLGRSAANRQARPTRKQAAPNAASAIDPTDGLMPCQRTWFPPNSRQTSRSTRTVTTLVIAARSRSPRRAEPEIDTKADCRSFVRHRVDGLHDSNASHSAAFGRPMMGLAWPVDGSCRHNPSP